jgi:hypothetical protein
MGVPGSGHGRYTAPWWLALVLGAFLVTVYGPSLRLPFMGDDYLFLDKTRDASFPGLWSFKNTDFGFYRPWSREFHFWLLQKAAGTHPVAYRLAGMALWIGSICLYASLIRLWVGGSVAVLAAAGVASLALWGTPLLWASGSQDLWMLCLTLGRFRLFAARRNGWALLLFGLALLSKETAAVLPVLLVGYGLLVERNRPREAIRRTLPFWLTVVAWAVIHPALRLRMLGMLPETRELEYHRPMLATLARSILAMFNMDALPRPQEVTAWDITRFVASALILSTGVALALRPNPGDRGTHYDPGSRRRLLVFGLLWALAGWSPLILPTIGWHAYYGCLGVMGAWFAVALWLEERPRVAVAAVAALALLRGARAHTLSWDWGAEGYQVRAARILQAIREDLARQYPVLPPHSRIYFCEIPNNIGLIAGRSPALRVWYRDSTLQAGFYSDYRRRETTARFGTDYFFRFDSLAGMIEVRPGPEDPSRGVAANPRWEHDHEVLAMLFLRNGDAARAAVEFEKLSLLPLRPEAAGYAGVCWEAAGDSSRADSLLAAARARMAAPRAGFERWVTQLRATLPASR